VAKAKKIPLQHEAMSATSGTDTDVIFWTRGGIASALIQFAEPLHALAGGSGEPERFGKIPELLAAFALSLKKGEQFKVKI